jgi:hypothetical protein
VGDQRAIQPTHAEFLLLGWSILADRGGLSGSQIRGYFSVFIGIKGPAKKLPHRAKDRPQHRKTVRGIQSGIDTRNQPQRFIVASFCPEHGSQQQPILIFRLRSLNLHQNRPVRDDASTRLIIGGGLGTEISHVDNFDISIF